VAMVSSRARRCCWTLVLALACCIASSLFAPPARAQAVGSTFDPFPLRPPDTSSPRDTLRSFLTDSNQAIRGWRSGRARQDLRKSARRAFETFDLSQLPDRGRFAKEIETALQLREILDRIPLPQMEEIPGDADIAGADQPLASWAIPDIRIVIARQADGPRQGEYLFSADTVANLSRYYELTKDLPYKPGALIGIYEDFILSPGGFVPRSWAAALPTWSKTPILEQGIWQWLSLVIVLGVAVGAARWLYGLGSGPIKGIPFSGEA